MDELIFRVDLVELARVSGEPLALQIMARGTTRRGSYVNPRLIAHIYAEPPVDRIWNYDFVATPIRNPLLSEPKDVEAETILVPIPLGIKGIRVISETKRLAELL